MALKKKSQVSRGEPAIKGSRKGSSFYSQNLKFGYEKDKFKGNFGSRMKRMEKTPKKSKSISKNKSKSPSILKGIVKQGRSR